MKGYHVVFTVQNVYLKDLARTINVMYSGFYRLVRYFDGRKCIRGVNFSQLVRPDEMKKKKSKNTKEKGAKTK